MEAIQQGEKISLLAIKANRLSLQLNNNVVGGGINAIKK
jgi:hypothetical protein